MKKQIFDYFYYTRRERNGAVILAALCLVVSFAPCFYPLLEKPQKTDFAAFQSAIAEWDKAQPVEQDSLFQFDPNTASENDLVLLGIPAKTVGTLMNYRNKGGRFYQKEDLKKIYGFPEAVYDQLVPFIKIADKKPQKATFKTTRPAYADRTYKPKPKAPIIIDINQANAEEWKQLRGIGPVLSQRIVKFRDKLGGFSQVEQVAKTYGLPDSTFQAIKSQLRTSPILNKIAINEVDAATLQKHPFLDWRQAKAIVNYRELHGPFTGMEDLKKLHILSSELCAELNPYFEY